jgi:hypothetical protein
MELDGAFGHCLICQQRYRVFEGALEGWHTAPDFSVFVSNF